MEKLKFNPSNKKYYSEEFIKGFECGVERQFEKDKAELTPIVRGKWIETQKGIIVTDYKCSICGRTVRDDTGYNPSISYPYCHCGAKMKESEE